MEKHQQKYCRHGSRSKKHKDPQTKKMYGDIIADMKRQQKEQSGPAAEYHGMEGEIPGAPGFIGHTPA